MNQSKQLSEQEWRKKLSPEQYHVLREAGTEVPFTGQYYHNTETGVYQCAGCGQPLFSSETKYESNSGWPSFHDVVAAGVVELREDNSHGMNRIEVVCSNCGGHLGHLFNDGPPTNDGLHYCVNSCALEFKKGATQ